MKDSRHARRGLRRAAIAFSWCGLATMLAVGCSSQQPPTPPGSFARPTDVAFVCVAGNSVSNPDRWCAKGEGTLYAVVPQSAHGEIAAVNLTTGKILDNRRAIPGYTFVPTGEQPIAIEVPTKHPTRTYVANFGSRDVYVMETASLVSISNQNAAVQIVRLPPGGAGGAAVGTPTDMLLTPDESALIVVLPDLGQVLKLPIRRCPQDTAACNDGTIDEAAISTLDLASALPELPSVEPAQEPAVEYEVMCGGYTRPPIASSAPATVAPDSAPRPVSLALDSACDGEACQGRILIADEAWPVIHVLDVATLSDEPIASAMRTPIATGVPTRGLAVTPRVPAAFDPDATPSNEDGTAADGDADGGVADPTSDSTVPSTHYVYAIDATDGSVLVLENDRLIAVNRDPVARPDRLPIASRTDRRPASALALAVITPTFDPAGAPNQRVRDDASNGLADDACTDATHEQLSRRRLRGVFLTVAMSDGTVRVIDVYDMEHPVCRTCPSGVVAPDLVRHHPRILTDFFGADVDARIELQPVVDTPIFVSDNVGFRVRNDGSVATPNAPGLECIACSAGRSRAFPTVDVDADEDDAGTDDGSGECTADTSALVCMGSDPWIDTAEGFSFSYEGPIHGAFGGDGRFVTPEDADNRTGALEWVGSTPFCERGVLGDADIDALRSGLALTDCNEGVSRATGDALFIRSAVLDDDVLENAGENAAQRELCSKLRVALERDDAPSIAFPIVAAFEDRLAIRSTVVPSEDLDGVNTYAEIAPCLGEAPLVYEVRVLDSFTAFGTRSAFQHQVVADSTGRCRVSPNADPLITSRAWLGCTFRNRKIELRFQGHDDSTTTRAEPSRGVQLQVRAATTATPLSFKAEQPSLGISTGALVPVRLVYGTLSRELYLVDTHRSGLIPISLDPFPEAPTSSFY